MKSIQGAAMAKILILLAVVGALAGGWWVIQGKGRSQSIFADSPRARVERGDLTISLLQAGELEAKRSLIIKNESDRQAKIITIIDDGSFVRSGDLLVELDSEDLRDRLLKEQADVSRAEADLSHNEKGMEIATLKYNTDQESAILKVELAKLDLKKYIEAEYPQDKRLKEVAIKLGQEELNRAEDKLKWTEELTTKGYTRRQELEADRLEVERRRIELENKIEEQRILLDYTYGKELSQKENNLSQAEAELDRLIKTRESEIARDVANLESKRVTLSTARNSLKKVQDQVGNSKIYATFTGLVFYNQEGRNNQDRQIEKGANVYPRQAILQFPDLSAWTIKTGVPESIIEKVQREQKAYVTIDAVPDALIEAVVSKVNVVPDNSRWWDRSTKTYTVDLDIPTTPTATLKPGMSTMVEIIIEELKDVLYVPIQAVRSTEGRQFVYVAERGGSARAVEVQTGQSNEDSIHILSGLEEGQEVLLYAPVSTETRPGLKDRPLKRREQQETAEKEEKAA
ncbi:efflux RND transporter periplasmic adaptor subunit [bacterium]|nr:efflux RND transporter periplasmic adaptor subunit [bacterium]